MKKNIFGRQFKRDANERKALFKNLLTALVVNEKIKTTDAKAKAIKAAADKLVTKAKKGGRDAYRGLEAEVHHDAVVKLIDDLAGRFAARNGGYTRIVKMGKRVADNAPMSVIEWVEKAAVKADASGKVAVVKKSASAKVSEDKVKKAAPKKTGKKETKAKK